MRKGGPEDNPRRKMATLSTPRRTGGNTPAGVSSTRTLHTGDPSKPSAFRGLAKVVGVPGVSVRTGGPSQVSTGTKKLRTGGPNPASRTRAPIMSTNTPAAKKRTKKRKPFGVI